MANPAAAAGAAPARISNQLVDAAPAAAPTTVVVPTKRVLPSIFGGGSKRRAVAISGPKNSAGNAGADGRSSGGGESAVGQMGSGGSQKENLSQGRSTGNVTGSSGNLGGNSGSTAADGSKIAGSGGGQVVSHDTVREVLGCARAALSAADMARQLCGDGRSRAALEEVLNDMICNCDVLRRGGKAMHSSVADLDDEFTMYQLC